MHVAAGHAERGVVLADGVLVRPIEQAVHRPVGVVVQPGLADAEPVGPGVAAVVLLPAWCAPRRGYAVEVIGMAAAAAAAGYGRQAIGSRLGVPASTVGSWLRRLRGRADGLRRHVIGELAGFDSITPLPAGVFGSPLGEALGTVGTAVGAAQRRIGFGSDTTWALAGLLGLCRFMQPARAG